MAAGHGRADYLLYVDQRVGRRDRGQAGGHAAVRGGVAVGHVRRRACRPQVRLKALTVDGPAAVRVRGVRVGDALHQRLRPRARGPGGSSPSRGRRRWRGSSGTPRPTRQRRPGGPRSSDLPALRPSGLRPAQIDGDRRASSGQPGRAALRPVAGPDGDRRGQDLHRGHRVLPAAQARRLPPGAVPGRPQQPRRPDAARVPELRHPGRRPPVHRALQRRQAHRRRHGRLVATS